MRPENEEISCLSCSIHLTRSLVARPPVISRSERPREMTEFREPQTGSSRSCPWLLPALVARKRVDRSGFRSHPIRLGINNFADKSITLPRRDSGIRRSCGSRRFNFGLTAKPVASSCVGSHGRCLYCGHRLQSSHGVDVPRRLGAGEGLEPFPFVSARLRSRHVPALSPTEPQP